MSRSVTHKRTGGKGKTVALHCHQQKERFFGGDFSTKEESNGSLRAGVQRTVGTH